jgi:hypothetical protein
MSCSPSNPNCNCKKVPCGCESSISVAPPCSVGTAACPNPEPCAETWSDCCVIHNGDSFAYVTPGEPSVPGFVVYQGERFCDTLQRFMSYYECGSSSLVPTPYGLKSNVITSTTINISWTALSNVASYKVYIAPLTTLTFTLLGNVTANTTPNITATGLIPNRSYYIYVVAVDGSDNTSCPSVSLILTTKSA